MVVLNDRPAGPLTANGMDAVAPETLSVWVELMLVTREVTVSVAANVSVTLLSVPCVVSNLLSVRLELKGTVSDEAGVVPPVVAVKLCGMACAALATANEAATISPFW